MLTLLRRSLSGGTIPFGSSSHNLRPSLLVRLLFLFVFLSYFVFIALHYFFWLPL